MMNLLAGAFTGLGMMLSSLFGGHQGPPPQDTGSTTPRQHEGTTTFDGHMGMGTSTQDHLDSKRSPAIQGKVVSVSGTTITITGHSQMPMTTAGMPMTTATTTYQVDASTAKLIKFGKNTASSTPITLANISTGDSVLVIGTITGTSITATTVVDGFTTTRRPLPPGVTPMNRERMSTTTKSAN